VGWPHFDGNTSVSRACRQDPAIHLFRALVLPSASLLVFVWWLTARWLTLCSLASPRLARWIMGLGFAGALFLVLYATFLGTEGGVYRLMRRYGVYVFFGGTSVAQLLVTLTLRRDALAARREGREPAASPWVVGTLTALMVFLLAAGPINVAAAKVVGNDTVANVLEWWFAIAMAAALGVLAEVWWRVCPAAAQNVLYSTEFDDAAGWSLVDTSYSPPAGIVWDVDALPATPMIPFVSPPHSLNFNHPQLGLPAGGIWRGHATSPAITLSGTSGPLRLRFQYAYHHEPFCQWDAFTVQVVDAAQPSVVRFEECLSLSPPLQHWPEFEVPLDRAWGAVRVRFVHDTIDSWNHGEQGSFVDDLRIIEECGWSVHCEGEPQVGGAAGADLRVEGSTSIAAGDLRLVGAGFPLQTFATAFGGPQPAVIPLFNGVRCVGVGTSVRLGVAPTRDQGTPLWNLDLGAWPLATIAMAGQPLYLQTIYRDGPTVNFSDAVRIVVCP
jgi:hypothetical protein